MYEQTLYKVLPNHVKSKILKQKNRYKKWEYGYNEDHDFIVISKTGEIGEVYEIQNLKIALPKPVKDVPFAKPAFPNKLPKPLLYPNPVFNGLKLPDPKKELNPPLPARPPNCVPGIPNVNPANNAALPILLLATFFTAFLAFLKTFFKKYDLIPVPLISSPAPPNDFKSAASSGLI